MVCIVFLVGLVFVFWIDEWILLNVMNYIDSGNNGNKNSDRYIIGKEEIIIVIIIRNKYKYFFLFSLIY